MTVTGQAPVPPDSALYAASNQGRVYYWIGCTHAWGRLKAENILFFNTANAAEEAGYVASRQQGCGRQADGARVSPSGAGFCKVQDVIDGDTFSCASGVRVRLIAIDAPEMDETPYGDWARSALLSLLPIGDTVRLELDIQTTDRYGRILAYVYGNGGQMANLAMVRAGYAIVAVYPPNVRHVEALRRAATHARTETLGLWAVEAFECTPAQHRRGRCVDPTDSLLH